VAHTVIEVPAMAGDPTHAAADGPALLSAALAESGTHPATRRMVVSPFDGDSRAASTKLGGRISELVRDSVARADIPLVVAGSCDVAPAVLAGIRDARIGVVWIGAHADFNTPGPAAICLRSVLCRRQRPTTGPWRQGRSFGGLRSGSGPYLEPTSPPTTTGLRISATCLV
jgi:arginase family enzyme